MATSSINLFHKPLLFAANPTSTHSAPWLNCVKNLMKVSQLVYNMKKPIMMNSQLLINILILHISTFTYLKGFV